MNGCLRALENSIKRNEGLFFKLKCAIRKYYYDLKKFKYIYFVQCCCRYHCCRDRRCCSWSNWSHHSFSAPDEKHEKAQLMLSMLLNIQMLSSSTSENKTCETYMTASPSRKRSFYLYVAKFHVMCCLYENKFDLYKKNWKMQFLICQC